MPRVHFIAIGGSAMHNLAIALKKRGYQVTGSDDVIFEPARSRLANHHLLPEETGWFPEKITRQADYIILGMHARDDNPELTRANELGLKVYSFPEYIFNETKSKTRVVIAGSHGKSTITSMIIHVLKHYNYDFDYLVGAGLEGFEDMVRLSDTANTVILEGDEYFSSVLDKTPKFIRYNHNIGLISGIAWDHINAFPTRKIYEDQFEKFIRNTPPDGKLVYNAGDTSVREMVKHIQPACDLIPYDEIPFKIKEGRFFIDYGDKAYPLMIFGRHNMQNLAGARAVLNCLGIGNEQFFNAVMTFPGAKNRLEKIADKPHFTVYRDFAHAPSKVKASINSVKELNPERDLVAILELHTYSSLNPDFLSEYKDAMKPADDKTVYLDDHAMQIKGMKPISEEVIMEKFNDSSIEIIRNPDVLKEKIQNLSFKNLNLLLMSSGSFGGLDLVQLLAKK
jgi:UDP-N-acetylmuramate: L-alanyl-gamma-D-glutamyl-meso-diaminopimelate ligase